LEKINRKKGREEKKKFRRMQKNDFWGRKQKTDEWGPQGGRRKYRKVKRGKERPAEKSTLRRAMEGAA